MYEQYFKRLLDISLSCILSVFSIPLLVLLYLLVKIDSPGPFLFIQPRVGKQLKLFRIYKIRTMTNEASIDSLDQTKVYKTTKGPDDPRITNVGRLLRKTHLDELPQLLNVIKGDMSLVGVRPDAISQEKDYTERHWRKRHLKRPGITGLVQINDPNALFSENRD